MNTFSLFLINLKIFFNFSIINMIKIINTRVFVADELNMHYNIEKLYPHDSLIAITARSRICHLNIPTKQTIEDYFKSIIDNIH